MTGYSDEELKALIEDIESDRVERKESLKGEAPTKLREAVCAFANDLPDHRQPGVLFVGARDDGSPSGLEVTDELLRQLADIRSDGNITPPPSLTVSKRKVGDAEIAVVTVLPTDSPPVRFKGRIWVRVGPRRALATAQEESLLNERRRHRDRPFDVRPLPSATLADLNREVFEREYLPAAFAPEILDANERTIEQRLAATKMVSSAEDTTPTVLGVLVLSHRTRDFLPGAYIQFLRIRGTELGDPIADESVVDGSLTETLRRIDEKLEAHNTTRVDWTTQAKEARASAYPRAALQQLVRNALMHRTYEATHAPVRVSWFDDRIEITSPGGPFGMVRADNFGQPGVADYRNPNLAEAMRVLGYVQRFGVGIATARRLLEKNGNPPPEFDVQSTLISVTVKRSR